MGWVIEMSDLVKRLRDPAFGTETSERNLMEQAANRINQLERELEDKRDIHNEQARVVSELASQLAAEKALADRLLGYLSRLSEGYSAPDMRLIANEGVGAYRKARGL